VDSITRAAITNRETALNFKSGARRVDTSRKSLFVPRNRDRFPRTK